MAKSWIAMRMCRRERDNECLKKGKENLMVDDDGVEPEEEVGEMRGKSDDRAMR